MTIRHAHIDDAQQLITLFDTLDRQSTFMLLAPGERDLSLENQQKQMLNFIDSTSQVMFVKQREQAELVGFVVGVAGNFKRNKHSLYCVMGVVEQYQAQGIGKALLNRLQDWAKQHHIHRLELTVMAHNTQAIGLYKSFGFVQEGIKRDSIFIAGQFINELYMSKLLSEE